MSDHAISNARGWLQTIQEEVTALKLVQSGGDHDAEDACRLSIEESVLSVQVRDGWRSPGHERDSRESAEEYEILLSTGGPALRIFGDLESGQPDDWPKLQWQDWGTPWTDYEMTNEERDAVASFAQVFYFGE